MMVDDARISLSVCREMRSRAEQSYSSASVENAKLRRELETAGRRADAYKYALSAETKRREAAEIDGKYLGELAEKVVNLEASLAKESEAYSKAVGRLLGQNVTISRLKKELLDATDGRTRWIDRCNSLLRRIGTARDALEP